MFLNIFMSIEWMGIITFPCSLMSIYCRFFGQFWTRTRNLWEKWQPNSKKQGWGLVGGVSPSLVTPSSNSPPVARSTKAHINDSKGQPSKSRRATVIFNSRQPSSLSLGGLLGVPTCINKKVSSLSRLASSWYIFSLLCSVVLSSFSSSFWRQFCDVTAIFFINEDEPSFEPALYFYRGLNLLV